MKLKIKIRLSEYTKRDTGPNPGSIATQATGQAGHHSSRVVNRATCPVGSEAFLLGFARVSPFIIPVNLVGGDDFPACAEASVCALHADRLAGRQNLASLN